MRLYMRLYMCLYEYEVAYKTAAKKHAPNSLLLLERKLFQIWSSCLGL
jgi:hypothetical protein